MLHLSLLLNSGLEWYHEIMSTTGFHVFSRKILKNLYFYYCISNNLLVTLSSAEEWISKALKTFLLIISFFLYLAKGLAGLQGPKAINPSLLT